jgi:tryptophanyl-tRNA synthetase
VLSLVADEPELGRPVTGADDYLRAEIIYAASHEGARHLDDVLGRRTHIAVETPDRGMAALAEIAGLIAKPLRWDTRQAAREVGHYQAGIAAERASQEAGTDADANAIREAVPDIVPVLSAGEAGGNGAASAGARGRRSWRGIGGRGGVADGIRGPQPLDCAHVRATRVLRHPADRRLLPSRQLPRRRAAMGGVAGVPRRRVLRGGPARDHAAAGPGEAPAPDPDRGRASCSGPGWDPDRSIVFVQSHVPEHTGLTWVLSCLTGFGEASRMTQFKDKTARGGATQASVGLFSYPVLQAADILLYQTDQVPVGEDQRQHLELSRDLAARFNHRYGPTFTVPSAYILAGVAKITDLQEPAAKMSKSSSSPQGIVDVLDEPDVIRRKIARAVTDTGSGIEVDETNKPGITNLLRIYSALAGETICRPGIPLRRRGLRAVQEGPGRGRCRRPGPDPGTDGEDPGGRGGPGRPAGARGHPAQARARPTMETVMDRVGFLPGVRAR